MRLASSIAQLDRRFFCPKSTPTIRTKTSNATQRKSFTSRDTHATFSTARCSTTSTFCPSPSTLYANRLAPLEVRAFGRSRCRSENTSSERAYNRNLHHENAACFFRWESGPMFLPLTGIQKVLYEVSKTGGDWESALRSNISM